MNISFLHDLLNTLMNRHADLGSHKHPSSADPEQVRTLCDKLLASDGEASSIVLARQSLDLYEQLDTSGKKEFFATLTEHYMPDAQNISACYSRHMENPDGDTLLALFNACEPPRQELLRRLNLAPGGTYGLVRMRQDLQELLPEHPEFQSFDADFVHLFSSWFNRGFLVLSRIDWDSPASILEKVMRYEAVHEIRDWQDLQRRLAPQDRRCFAFFHPAIGDEPLIFVEVALTRGMPERTQPILDGEAPDFIDPAQADTAAFFGISNCQKGLQRISFGNFLIKQVVQELKRELPQLKNFVTLSPVPGFKRWLTQLAQDPDEALDSDTRAALALIDEPDWADDPEKAARLREVAMPLAVRYLTEEKDTRGRPRNPVARFHLRNGARLQRINWLGDRSDKGLEQSLGLMVNYLYVPDEIESNHERHMTDGTIVCSAEVRKLARTGKRAA
jgi:malonyl-CoA decarboxylase